MQHLKMNPGVFMPGKADEAHFACLLRFQRSFQATFFKYPIGIVVINHLMKLPEVQVIGLQAT